MKYLVYAETVPSASSDAPRQTGIGRYCHDLAFGLADIGHVVTVLTSRDGASVEDDTESKYTIVRGARSTLTRTGLVGRALLLKQQLSLTRPDYLLLGDSLAQRVFSCVRPFSKVPYCTFFYGTDLNTLSEKLSYQGWSPYKFVRRFMFTNHVGSAYETVVISRYTADRFLKIAGDHHGHFILYPCVSGTFLDLSVARPSRLERPEEKEGHRIRFITVARISERKNQFGVLKVLAHLRQTRQLSFHYAILGNTDAGVHEEYYAQIRAFIAGHGLEEAVSIIGQATDEEKIRHIDSSDVFMMLSRTVGNSVEGFGISVIEASVRGKPVIVSDQGGMPETILHGKTGFSVPVDDDDAISRAVMKLAANKGLRETMGAAGREYVLANFTPKIMASRLDNHLREMSSSGGRI